ncbi:MAG: tripartite tricarboxylate transporter TctB family protein [Planctomycetota bacterium]|jgi:hypothetical protein|nr:tripartite tricarboxylate transporter TctB family protein [Planctomycetota bacterium]
MDQDNRRLAGSDFIASAIFIATGMLTIILSLRMRIFRTIIVSPGLFPVIIGGVFVVFGGVIFILAIRRGGVAEAGSILSAANLLATWRSPRFRRGMTIFLAILAYVLLFGHPWLARLNFAFVAGDVMIPVNVSFFLTTGGYLVFNFFYLKAMRPSMAILVSILSALAIFYAFSIGFGVPVP